MRNRFPSLLILPAMILAAPACMAQAPEDKPHEHAGAEPAQEPAPHRSAFGRVMAVMIDALQQDAMRQEAQGEAHSAAAPEVRTTAGGTPLGIEVGDAFRLDAQPQTPKAARTGKSAPMPLAVQGDRID